MNKIRVIDLLNKIAKGEEVPNKIRYKNDIYIYYERLDDMFNYKTDDKRHRYLEENYYIENILNDEVEIIEEEKKIEKIDIDKMLQTKKWKRDKKTYQTINELIDEVNKLKGDKSERRVTKNN